MLQQLRPAIVSVLAFAVLTGLVFPAAITGIAQAVFPRQANGSLIRRDGKVVGSALIGQTFTSARYFHPRPSAAGGGYDAAASGGTNLGPTSAKLIHGSSGFPGIEQLVAGYRRENGLPADTVLPADALTRSASGLDPHISPANADLQVARVARARDLPEETVRALVASHTEGRTLGLLGDPRVNVLLLNLALDDLSKEGRDGTHTGD
jgi:K+-transporting ATPase ATPase C chain